MVGWPALDIVLVDNGPRDGSAEMLAEAARQGVCTLLANDVNRHHGPALNQGIAWVAAQAGALAGWIGILDSDVVAARPGVLGEARAAAQHQSAALVGEPQWDPWHQVERFGSHSLLLDPARVWRPGIGPFSDDGDPAFRPLPPAPRPGVGLAPCPFTPRRHFIHPGRGTPSAAHSAGARSPPRYA